MVEHATSFVDLQKEFTAHLRNPEKNTAPSDLEDRRVGIYRDLLYNNVESFMSDSFPVLRSIIDDDAWHRLIRAYFSEHAAKTPLFPKLPLEFLQFLETTSYGDTPAFMRELAHYEWLEMEAFLDKRDLDSVTCDPNKNVMDGVPQLNPTARAEAYDFPVHRISPEFQPDAAPDEQTYLVVYRGRDESVGFMALNPITARLLALMIAQAESNGRQLLEQIAEELQHPKPQVVIDGGRQILEELSSRDVILGAT